MEESEYAEYNKNIEDVFTYGNPFSTTDGVILGDLLETYNDTHDMRLTRVRYNLLILEVRKTHSNYTPNHDLPSVAHILSLAGFGM